MIDILYFLKIISSFTQNFPEINKLLLFLYIYRDFPKRFFLILKGVID